MFKYVLAFVVALLLMVLLQNGCDKLRNRRWNHQKERQEHREERRDERKDGRFWNKDEPDKSVNPPYDQEQGESNHQERRRIIFGKRR